MISLRTEVLQHVPLKPAVAKVTTTWGRLKQGK